MTDWNRQNADVGPKMASISKHMDMNHLNVDVDALKIPDAPPGKTLPLRIVDLYGGVHK